MPNRQKHSHSNSRGRRRRRSANLAYTPADNELRQPPVRAIDAARGRPQPAAPTDKYSQSDSSGAAACTAALVALAGLLGRQAARDDLARLRHAALTPLISQTPDRKDPP